MPSPWPRGSWPIGPAIAQRSWSGMLRDLMMFTHGVEATRKPNNNYRSAAHGEDWDHREGERKMPI